ncbi:endonuclease domain-containing protein [Arthrobacter oryzae]|uniref:endonuclease domain-containing protein n=1 Tax=Arthrobacter oryzae TaxID=409290 RepID=UPI0030C96662
MKKCNNLPGLLATAPFTVESARAAGVSPDRLRRKDVVHIGRGLYRPSDWSFELEAAARALSAASPGAWISHVTAARLRCQLLPPWLAGSTELHLSKPRSLPSVRRKGVVGHTVFAREDEIESIDGISISTRSRTWLDLARRLSVNDLVCLGDQLIRIPRVDFEGRTQPYDTLDGLRSLVGRHPNLQGVVRARDALDLMRVGSDSAPESLLRLAMADAGLPEPDLQLSLRDADGVSPSADLGYRHRRVAIQYDGEHHLLDAQSLSDRRRNKAFESAGWTVLIFDKDDLADDFQSAIGKIKRTLRTAWLDHSHASGFADAG